MIESVQKRLLAESALTLDGAIKIAHAMETAGRDATELREQRNTSATVHKVGSQKSKPKPQMQKHSPASQQHKDSHRPCWRCGYDHSVKSLNTCTVFVTIVQMKAILREHVSRRRRI